MATKPPIANVLTDIEAKSAVWLKVKAHLEKRLTDMREKNDANAPERETAFLRGRIRELKNLVALDKPAPQTEDNDDFKD